MPYCNSQSPISLATFNLRSCSSAVGHESRAPHLAPSSRHAACGAPQESTWTAHMYILCGSVVCYIHLGPFNTHFDSCLTLHFGTAGPEDVARRSSTSGITITPHPHTDVEADLELCGAERDSEYWFSDGNVVLLARGVASRVYRGPLAIHSSIFNDTFSIPQPQRTAHNSCEVIRLDDSPEALCHLFRIIMPGRTIQMSVAPVSRAILTAAMAKDGSMDSCGLGPRRASSGSNENHVRRIASDMSTHRIT
ncbi:hypothetical protein L226DRAFT_147200 [Lentinus tigrinus ALCF2SS1-7]|uniref:uncharacterized protein n=1 Tax=Lentinus tigrinus ALCF2SS1-7 TaxID=1328758 RepID=UPI001165DBFF|nr:hypothetical protein L226DRAFT_147200 [Lentinus tigrinus ALCF2SS1-7]